MNDVSCVKMPLAVYTSYDGYRWDDNAKLSKAQREVFEKAFKQKHGKFPPEANSIKAPQQGIYEIGDDVFIYRYWLAKRYDDCGRDALYFVLGVLPKAELLRLDIEKLLTSDEFTKEMK